MLGLKGVSIINNTIIHHLRTHTGPRGQYQQNSLNQVKVLRSVTSGEAAAPRQGCIYKYIYSSLYFDGGFKVLSCNPGELGFNRDLHKAALIVRPSERAIV